MHLGTILKDKAGSHPAPRRNPIYNFFLNFFFFFFLHFHILTFFLAFSLPHFSFLGPVVNRGDQEANFIYINIHMKIVTYKKEKKKPK